MEILKVQNLCKTYGSGESAVTALKDVSFSLEKGEFAAVVGASGSGKSTLLNCIGGLDTPTSGSIWLNNENLLRMKEELRTEYRLCLSVFSVDPGTECGTECDIPAAAGQQKTRKGSGRRNIGDAGA